MSAKKKHIGEIYEVHKDLHNPHIPQFCPSCGSKMHYPGMIREGVCWRCRPFESELYDMGYIGEKERICESTKEPVFEYTGRGWPLLHPGAEELRKMVKEYNGLIKIIVFHSIDGWYWRKGWGGIGCQHRLRVFARCKHKAQVAVDEIFAHLDHKYGGLCPICNRLVGIGGIGETALIQICLAQEAHNDQR